MNQDIKHLVSALFTELRAVLSEEIPADDSTWTAIESTESDLIAIVDGKLSAEIRPFRIRHPQFFGGER